MATIKKITTKTVFLITAVIGLGFFPAFLWRLFFGGSEVNLTKLGSVTERDASIPVARADVPPSTTSVADGSLTTDGGCSGSGDGSADGSAGF